MHRHRDIHAELTFPGNISRSAHPRLLSLVSAARPHVDVETAYRPRGASFDVASGDLSLEVRTGAGVTSIRARRQLGLGRGLDRGAHALVPALILLACIVSGLVGPTTTILGVAVGLGYGGGLLAWREWNGRRELRELVGELALSARIHARAEMFERAASSC